MKFPFKILRTSQFEDTQKKFNEINKKLETFEKILPQDREAERLGSEQTAVLIPHFQYNERYLYRIAMQSDIVRTIINTVRDGIFRRGFEIKEIEDVEPNETERELLDNLIKKSNLWEQPLDVMLGVAEQDANVLDNAYIICQKSYAFAGAEPVVVKVNGFVAADAKHMRLISDKQGNRGRNRAGETMYVSLTNRSELVKESEARKTNFIDRDGHYYQVAYYRGEQYTDSNEPRYSYFTKDEVIHYTKEPANIYGYSKLYSVWQKIFTLLYQDKYMRTYYSQQRSPKGFLAVTTTNYQSFKANWEEVKKQAKTNPYKIQALINETGQDTGAKIGIEFIDLSKPLTEMEYTETRNELRRTIGAIYGVTPIYQGDISQSGGLNNESQQIAITNRALEKGQKVYNETVLPWMVKQLGIETLELALKEVEERDEADEIKIMGMKMDNAQKMALMGFNVQWNEDDEEFIFSSEALEPNRQTSSNPTEEEITDPAGTPNKSIQKSLNLIQEEINKGIDDFGTTPEFLTFIKAFLWKEPFEGLSKSLSDEAKDKILTSMINKETFTETANRLERLGIEKNQAEVIAKTERNSLNNGVREFNFKQQDPENEFKYRWIGPQDNRTTEVSKEIKLKSAKGLPLNELKQLVRKTAQKFGFRPERDWQTHPNGRHFFSRLVK